MSIPLTIHLVGAQRSNYPWGFENRVIPALESLGHRVISTDFRMQRADLPALIRQDADLVLVCKGEGIPPEVLRAAPCPTALWYAELLGTADECDDIALMHRKQMAYNIAAYDYVFGHDQASIDVIRGLGARRAYWLPTAHVDPAVYNRLDLPKTVDVAFVGVLSDRRRRFVDALKQDFSVQADSVWDPAEVNRLYNSARIVLNIHTSDLLNTETRLWEVLGAGAFLLSEELSVSGLFLDGVHLGIFRRNDIDDLRRQVVHYLAAVEDRERIADTGYHFVHEQHTLARRVQQLLDTVDWDLRHRSWPGHDIGVTFDEAGKPTRSLSAFYAAVARACGTA